MTPGDKRAGKESLEETVSYLHLEVQGPSLTWAFPFPGLPVVEGQDPE